MDAVSPPTSCRRQVHEMLTLGSKKTAARCSMGSQATPPDIPNLSASTPPLSAGASTVSEGCLPSLGRGLLPSVSWLKNNRFVECSGKKIMDWLEAALQWLEREAVNQENSSFVFLATDDSSTGREDDGPARLQWRRLNSFLLGIRELCEECDIHCDTAARAAAANLENATRRIAAERAANVPFGLRVGGAAVAAASEAAARTAGSGASPSADDDHRWDGWLVLAMAVTLAVSEDRVFLCRCVLESVWGTEGLPRPQIIELLCKIHLAVRPPAKARTQQSAGGFQAASSVSTVKEWDETGSYRLRNDLMQCICALESYFVRCDGL